MARAAPTNHGKKFVRFDEGLTFDLGFFHRVDGSEDLFEGPCILGAEEFAIGHFGDLFHEVEIEFLAHAWEVAAGAIGSGMRCMPSVPTAME